LNPKAVEAANAKMGLGRPLTNDPADAPLRAQWMREYQAAGGQVFAAPAAPKPITSPSCGCPGQPAKPPPKPAKPPTQKEKPCDLETVTLTEIAVMPKKESVWQGGRWVDAPPDPKQKVRKLTCPSAATPAPPAAPAAAAAVPGRTLEVIGGRSDQAATQIALNVAGGPGYQCGGKHPIVTVSGGGVAKQYAGIGAANAARFPVFRAPASVDSVQNETLRQILQRWWPFAFEPQIYDVDVDVCGIRPGGASGVGRQSLAVHVFPADTYALALKIPAYRQTKVSSSGSRNLKGDAKDDYSTSTTERGPGGEQRSGYAESFKSGNKSTEAAKSITYTNQQGEHITHTDGMRVQDGKIIDTSKLAGEQGDQTTTYSDDPEDKPIKLDQQPPSDVELEIKHNGVRSESTAAITEVINTVKYWEHTFKEVWNFLRDWVPQVGWKFDLDISVFSGELAFEWGYKEYSDHRVYGAWSGSVGVDVLAVSVDVSFGVQMSKAAVAKLSGKASGKLRVDHKLSRTSPDSPWGPNEGSRGKSVEIDLDFGGVVAVGGPTWFRFERKAGFRSGFDAKAEFKIDRFKGFSIEYEITIRPVQFYYIKKGWFTADEASYKRLTDKHSTSGEFPTEDAPH
jgi:hypothetical protein